MTGSEERSNHASDRPQNSVYAVDQPSPGLDLLASQVESILFVASEPVSLRELARLLDSDSDTILTAVQHLLGGSSDRGIYVQLDGFHLQLATKPDNADVVRRFLQITRPNRLSRPALETLSIICYRQPITRAEIEQLRGIGVERVLAGLMSRGLIQEVGRRHSPGTPIEYGTTFAFLEFFGLQSLSELPPVLENAPVAPALGIFGISQQSLFDSPSPDAASDSR